MFSFKDYLYLKEKHVSLDIDALKEIESYFKDFENKLISKADFTVGGISNATWTDEEFNKLNNKLSKYNISIDDMKGERTVEKPFYYQGHIYLPNSIIQDLGLGSVDDIMTVIGHEMIHSRQDIKSGGKMENVLTKYMKSHPKTKNAKSMEDVAPENKNEVESHYYNYRDEVTAQAYSYAKALRKENSNDYSINDVPKIYPYSLIYKKLSPENKKRFMRIASEYYNSF